MTLTLTQDQQNALDALEEVLGCLENWMEIADVEDQRDYDRDAVKKAKAVIKKIKGS